MFSANWLRGPRTAQRAPRRQLSLECLESRLLLTFTPIAQPTTAYLSETTKIPIPATVADGTTVTALVSSDRTMAVLPALLENT